MTTIEFALSVASDAHRGQLDRDGNPVILHPLAVGLMGKTDEEKVVGFLHDVVEDTLYSLDDLHRLGFDDNILTALDLLTHRENDTYKQYIDKIAGSCNRLAINVKLNDLTHNIARGKEHNLTSVVRRHEEAYKILSAI